MKNLRKINLYKKMNTKLAIAYAEGKKTRKIDQEKMLCAWQYLVDNGICWKKDVWHGRMAFFLIENNFISK